MDIIEVKNLQIRNVIGVDSWERSKKQPLNITLTLHTDISASGDKDILSASVHYGLVTKAVHQYSEKSSCRSIEALAIGIIRCCFTGFQLEKVTVRVEKPKGLLHAACAGVEMTRTKSDIDALIQLEKETPRLNFRKALMEDDGVGEDVIFVKELTLSTIIGVNAWERVEKQRVLIDIQIHLELKSDFLLGDVVPRVHNYRSIARIVTEKVEASDYKTVEALITMIAKLLIIDCHAPKVTVKVRKPSALVFADSAGLQIVRDRNSFKQELKAREDEVLKRDAGLSQHLSYIAVGSNLGNKLANIQNAIETLSKADSIKVLATSFLYETAPMYVQDQPAFLNAVFKIQTTLSPQDLLKLLKKTEADFGRDFGTVRFGPRSLDLDIIFFDNLELSDESLIIPHPRLAEREFVLRPLCDIAPNVEHPTLFKTCSQLLSLLSHSEGYVPNSINRVFPIGSSLWALGQRTYVMGILNVTPDSFSDGGKFVAPDIAINHVKAMIDSGADIIDIGGQSTRPNAEEVSIEEEVSRVVPVIKEIRARGITVPISVDTYRGEVAKLAIEAGADMINDVSGATLDPSMIDYAASLKVPICLMHMRGTPKTMTQLTQYENNDVVTSVKRDLSSRVSWAIQSGIYRWNIITDPGIGFAKTPAQSFELIRSLKKLTEAEDESLGVPVLVGPSRKSFLSAGLNVKKEPEERVWGTAAACTASVAGGATFLRVHDVKEMRDVIDIADKLYR
ncbi:trifunctional dihydropteroate synthetase [Dinochytrium kinnereticum]|nr:trifunctional dihydropteroate synthetase [Dinochytrium kinnereticum]